MRDRREGAVLIGHAVQVSTIHKCQKYQINGGILFGVIFVSRFWPLLLSLPAQYGHGLSVILAAQQLVDVGVQHGERQLKDDLNAVVEEAVHDHYSALERHDRQEEGEEPGERDGGDDPKVLHAVVQLRDVLAGELLKHSLIDEGSWGRLGGEMKRMLNK